VTRVGDKFLQKNLEFSILQDKILHFKELPASQKNCTDIQRGRPFLHINRGKRSFGAVFDERTEKWRGRKYPGVG